MLYDKKKRPAVIFCIIAVLLALAGCAGQNVGDTDSAETPGGSGDTPKIETDAEPPQSPVGNGATDDNAPESYTRNDVGWAVYNDGYTYFIQDGQMTPPYRSMLLRVSDAQDAEVELLFGSTERMDNIAVFDGQIYFVQESRSRSGSEMSYRYELSRLGESPMQWEVLRTFSEETFLFHADDNRLYYESGGDLLRMDAAGNEEAVQSRGMLRGMYGTDVYYTKFTGSDDELLQDYCDGLYRFNFEKALSDGSKESEVLVDADYFEVLMSEAWFSGSTVFADNFAFFPAEPYVWEEYADLRKLDLETGESSLVRINTEWYLDYTVCDGRIYYFKGKSLYRTTIESGDTERLFEGDEENRSDYFFYAPKVLDGCLYYRSYSLDTWFSVHRFRLDGTAAVSEDVWIGQE